MENKEKNKLTSFQTAFSRMSNSNDYLAGDSYESSYRRRTTGYSTDQVELAIENGSLEEQRKISMEYFEKDGIYSRIIMYYATLLFYKGILIPHAGVSQKLSTPFVSKKYYLAQSYVDDFFKPEMFADWTRRVFTNGAYYGMVDVADKKHFSVIDLPSSYCRAQLKDQLGNLRVEFNVSYFNSITDEKKKTQILKAFPKVITSAYRKYIKGTGPQWVILPADLAFCFTLTNSQRPFLLSTIPATIRYDQALEAEKEKELEEIKKIIVQKMPHLNDGTLVFEPEEAAEMHSGTVNMMKGNKNIAVLTSYGDVDAIVSHSAVNGNSKLVEKNLQNVYTESGVSSQLFAPTGGQSLKVSIQNDMALVMYLANKYSTFVSNILNQIFGNTNIQFSYAIQPISLYNQSDYITDTLKLAQAGYSFLLPALGSGLSQRDLLDTKKLENDLLKLPELLIPLASSYTQSAADGKKEEDKKGATDEGGAPVKKVEEKAEKTIKNEQSKENEGGSK